MQDAQSTLLHFNRSTNDKNKNLSTSFSIWVQTFSPPLLSSMYVCTCHTLNSVECESQRMNLSLVRHKGLQPSCPSHTIRSARYPRDARTAIFTRRNTDDSNDNAFQFVERFRYVVCVQTNYANLMCICVQGFRLHSSHTKADVRVRIPFIAIGAERWPKRKENYRARIHSQCRYFSHNVV